MTYAEITRPTHRERASLREYGRSLRDRLPPKDVGDWSPAPERDPIGILERQAETRLPDLVPFRYGRMALSPLAFYRGAAAIMAADLASTATTGVHVQACGDAHIMNFGLYATPERALVFDINDFDETLPAPWEWDVKRLAASVVLASRTIRADAKEAEAATRAAVEAYVHHLDNLAHVSTLEVWYSRVTAEDALHATRTKVGRRAHARAVEKARGRTPLRAFEKLTVVKDGRRVLIDDPPFLEHRPEATPDSVSTFLEGYSETLPGHRAHLVDQFDMVDAALKVVGVGSVGTRDYVIVGVGRAGLDPMLLQVKEAEPSVFEPFVGRSHLDHCGQRVVEGQRLMQAASDQFLGWSTGPEGRHFYVRQLQDMKGSVKVEQLSPAAMRNYAERCATALARAHARSLDPALLAGYGGQGRKLAKGVHRFAVAYADQTERDHAALVDATRDGRVEAHLKTAP